MSAIPRRKQILVRSYSYKYMLEDIKNFTKILIKKGIKCQTFLIKRMIVTNDFIFRFVVIPMIKPKNKWRRPILGMRADGCINFDEEDIGYITKGKKFSNENFDNFFKN